MRTILNLLPITKRVENTNYFDYPASLRKRLLVKAVRMANEMQLNLVRQYPNSK